MSVRWGGVGTSCRQTLTTPTRSLNGRWRSTRRPSSSTLYTRTPCATSAALFRTWVTTRSQGTTTRRPCRLTPTTPWRTSTWACYCTTRTSTRPSSTTRVPWRWTRPWRTLGATSAAPTTARTTLKMPWGATKRRSDFTRPRRLTRGFRSPTMSSLRLTTTSRLSWEDYPTGAACRGVACPRGWRFSGDVSGTTRNMLCASTTWRAPWGTRA
ncbi:unnamed protein product [Ectocarpus fasciculatus]